MIISASRRTDIPAFYTPWLLGRLRERYALVRNPVNTRLVYHVSLSAESVRCLVLWTKNPAPLVQRIAELEDFGIPFYILFTVTPYGPELERNLPPKREVLSAFTRLSRRLGAKRLIWRYDPILFTAKYTPAVHLQRFRELARQLSGCTRRCIVSYLTMYNKCRRNLAEVQLRELPAAQRAQWIAGIRDAAAREGMELTSCASDRLVGEGVAAGRCVDDALISRIGGSEYVGRKDRCQRPACGCVESVDIGAYDSCLHNCLYCYANSNPAAAERRYRLHDPDSPLLFGRVGEGDRLLERTGPRAESRAAGSWRL